MQVTVGSKYQVVIPKEIRQKIKGLHPGSKVVIHNMDNKTIAIKLIDRNWIEKSRGLMKDAWKDSNAVVELEKMRNEWESKS